MGRQGNIGISKTGKFQKQLKRNALNALYNLVYFNLIELIDLNQVDSVQWKFAAGCGISFQFWLSEETHIIRHCIKFAATCIWCMKIFC